jgi:DNA transposition AAA+ family ATPase
MAKKKQEPTLGDQIREHLEGCGMSRYRISKETGIDAAALCRFAAGTHGLELSNLDKIAALLDLKVIKRRKPKKGE